MSRPAALGALALAGLLTAACSTTPPPQSALIKRTGDIQMSTVELKLRVYGYAEEFSGDVEEAADRIIAATDDPRIVRQALRWKINILSATQVAAFALDPLIGLLDMWVLAVQMRDFFQAGSGRAVFAEHQSIAVETARDLERRINELAASISVSGEISDWQRDVEEYAAARPLTGMHFVRETATREFAEFLRDETGGLSVLGDLSIQVGDLSERLKYYAATLPAQIRWQSELLLLDVTEDGAVEDFLNDVASVNASAERLAILGDSIPTLVDEQAKAAIAALSDNLAASLREVDRQRLATLVELSRERIAVMEQLSAERIAVMEQLAAILDSALVQAPSSAEQVVDHAFRRALLLLALMFGGGLVFAYLLRLIWRRS
ncbi:MAG: hypothetical protein JSV95_00310 [Gemmatimonadota bacterium]|jgi:hypothetical protein|nr:MAG: hypothetical protein JSV95_00310 [Gemmatimonadota bacterium]